MTAPPGTHACSHSHGAGDRHRPRPEATARLHALPAAGDCLQLPPCHTHPGPVQAPVAFLPIPAARGSPPRAICRPDSPPGPLPPAGSGAPRGSGAGLPREQLLAQEVPDAPMLHPCLEVCMTKATTDREGGDAALFLERGGKSQARRRVRPGERPVAACVGGGTRQPCLASDWGHTTSSRGSPASTAAHVAVGHCSALWASLCPAAQRKHGAGHLLRACMCHVPQV